MLNIFSEHLSDPGFLTWMANKFKLLNHSDLTSFSAYADTIYTESRGRKMFPLEIRTEVYNFWKLNSQVTVHRSNEVFS